MTAASEREPTARECQPPEDLPNLVFFTCPDRGCGKTWERRAASTGQPAGWHLVAPQ